jgi:hypothetical protein
MFALYVGQTDNVAWWKPILPKLASAGIGGIRVVAEWTTIETSQGHYDWSGVDSVMALAAQYGLRVSMCVGWPPSWSSPVGGNGGPANPALFGGFVGALVAHAGSRLSSVEIWNEPNATGYFKAYVGKTLPQSYVSLLQPAYTAAKAANPSVQIIAGNSDSRYSSGTDFYAQDDWLTACYAAGAKGYFDEWATHNYAFTLPPEFVFGAWANGRSPWGVVDNLRTILNANGDSAKPLAITEVGWAMSGASGTHESMAPSLAAQSRYTQRNILLAMAHGIVLYEAMFDFDISGYTAGFFNADTSARPVATAVSALQAALKGATFSGYLNVGAGNYALSFLRPDGSSIVAAWTTKGEIMNENDVRSTANPNVTILGKSVTLTNDPVLVVQS